MIDEIGISFYWTEEKIKDKKVEDLIEIKISFLERIFWSCPATNFLRYEVNMKLVNFLAHPNMFRDSIGNRKRSKEKLTIY